MLNEFYDESFVKINRDDPDDIDLIHEKELDYYKSLFANKKITFIDEAQKIPEIDNTVKLLVDHYKTKKPCNYSIKSQLFIYFQQLVF